MAKTKNTTKLPSESDETPQSVGATYIQSDVPPPKVKTRLKYFFTEMLQGDSFFAPGKTKKQLVGLCYLYGKKLGGKYVAEQRTEDSVDGTRVWRID